MEQNFSTMFQDVRHERFHFLILSLTDPDILKQSKLTDLELNIIKYLASEKMHRQNCLKEYFALQILEEFDKKKFKI